MSIASLLILIFIEIPNLAWKAILLYLITIFNHFIPLMK